MDSRKIFVSFLLIPSLLFSQAGNVSTPRKPGVWVDNGTSISYPRRNIINGSTSLPAGAPTGSIALSGCLYFNGPQDPTCYGAVGGGTIDDVSAIQATINSGAHDIRVPCGKFKLGSKLIFSGITGLHFTGCAQGNSNAAGTEFLPAIMTTSPALLMNGVAKSIFENFILSMPCGSGGVITVGAGINFQTLTGFTQTGNLVRNVTMQGVNGCLDYGIRVSSTTPFPGITAGPDGNNDVSRLENVTINNYKTAALSIEGTQAKNWHLNEFTCIAGTYGQRCITTNVNLPKNGGFDWDGGSESGDLTAAVDIGTSTDPITIKKVRAELPARFLLAQNINGGLEIDSTVYALPNTGFAQDGHGIYILSSSACLTLEGFTTQWNSGAGGIFNDVYIRSNVNGRAACINARANNWESNVVLPSTPFNVTTTTAWQSNHVYALNDLILDTNFHIQRVITAGTSTNGSHPTWNTALSTTTDNTVVWQDCGLKGPVIVNSQGNTIARDDGNGIAALPDTNANPISFSTQNTPPLTFTMTASGGTGSSTYSAQATALMSDNSIVRSPIMTISNASDTLTGSGAGVAMTATAPSTNILQYLVYRLSYSGTGGANGLILTQNGPIPFSFTDRGTSGAGETPAVATTGQVNAGLYLTTTNCSSSASPAVCVAAPSGAAVIAAAATTVVVNVTPVTANSNIQITADSSLGTRLGVTCNTQATSALGAPRVTARTAGVSFTVALDVAPTTNPFCFTYDIKN